MRTVYPVCDRAGTVVAEHVRLDLPGGKKTAYWQLPGGTPGLGGLSTPDLPLYGSEIIGELVTGQLVILTEGEKAARALWPWGLPALGTVTGAGSTPGEDALGVLFGFDVVLWPDHDAAGYGHMNRAAHAMVRLGMPMPRGLTLDPRGPGGHLHRPLAKGYDAADYVACGGTLAALRPLLRAAPQWPYAPPAPPRPAVRRPIYVGDSRREAARAHLLDTVVADLGAPARQTRHGYWWCCPFHTERTPSFKVALAEPYFKCFGCGEGGDVFDYLGKRRNQPFAATLRQLAPGLGPIPLLGYAS